MKTTFYIMIYYEELKYGNVSSSYKTDFSIMNYEDYPGIFGPSFDGAIFNDDILDALTAEDEENKDDFAKIDERSLINFAADVAIVSVLAVSAVLSLSCIVFASVATKASFRILYIAKSITIIASCTGSIVCTTAPRTLEVDEWSHKVVNDGLMSSIGSVGSFVGSFFCSSMVNLERIFTLLLMHDLYQRVCTTEKIEFRWRTFFRNAGILGGASLVKDVALMLHYLFRDTETLGDEAWKDATFPMNSLVMALVTAAAAIFWGAQIIYKIVKSRWFRQGHTAAGSSENNRSQNQIVLVKFVVWMLITNVARAGFCFLRLAKTSHQYKYVFCMHSSLENDYEAGHKKCQHFMDDANWRFITDIPVISIVLSVSDILTVPLLKFCNLSS